MDQIKAKSKKNGKIEWMRFVFCIVIIFFHCYDRFKIGYPLIGNLPVSFFPRGYIGVEFFFLVSGYLMAKSAFGARQRPDADVGAETLRFIWRKYRGIFPYHLIAFAALFVQVAVQSGVSGMKFLEYILNVIPGFLLIQKFGFNYNNINSIEWYISAMLLAMFLLYPICRKYYSMFVHVIAPLGGLYICGYLIYTNGSLTGASVWTGFGFVCVFRAIAEIALGASAFEAARVLSEKELPHRTRRFLTVLEAAGYIGVLAYTLAMIPGKYEIYPLLVLMGCVTLSFSGKTYGMEFFDRPWAYTLGSFSLPLYLCQLLPINILKAYAPGLFLPLKILLVLVFTALSAVICRALGSLLDKKMRKLGV